MQVALPLRCTPCVPRNFVIGTADSLWSGRALSHGEKGMYSWWIAQYINPALFGQTSRANTTLRSDGSLGINDISLYSTISSAQVYGNSAGELNENATCDLGRKLSEVRRSHDRDWPGGEVVERSISSIFKRKHDGMWMCRRKVPIV